MPFIERVAAGRLPRLTVHGGDYESPDGTAERDYLHVVDLALGHVAALDWLFGLSAGAFEFINLGTGRPVSVLQMFAAYEKACGCPRVRAARERARVCLCVCARALACSLSPVPLAALLLCGIPARLLLLASLARRPSLSIRRRQEA